MFTKELQRWQVGLAFAALWLLGANDGAFGVILPSLRGYFAIDKATAGLLFFGGTIGYFVAAFSSGLLVHRLGTRKFLIVGTLAMVLAWTIQGQKPAFFFMWLGAVILGFGVGTVDAGFNTYIARLPGSARLLNFIHGFYGIGALTGPIIATTILEAKLDWAGVYWCWIVVGLLISVGIWFILKIPYTSENSEAGDEHSGKSLFGATLRLPLVWIGAFFLLFYVGAEVTLGNWSFTFLTEERREGQLFAGWMVSGYWLGLTVGRLTLAHAAERIGSAKLISFCVAGSIGAMVILWALPFTWAAALGLWVAGFCLGPIFPTMIALMPTLVPERLLASAIGFLTSLGSAGAAFLPWLAGTIAEGVGLWSLMPFVMVQAAAMLGLWLLLQQKKQPAAQPLAS